MEEWTVVVPGIYLMAAMVPRFRRRKRFKSQKGRQDHVRRCRSQMLAVLDNLKLRFPFRYGGAAITEGRLYGHGVIQIQLPSELCPTMLRCRTTFSYTPRFVQHDRPSRSHQIWSHGRR